MIHGFDLWRQLTESRNFSSCREKGRAAFVSYVCACDPNFEISLEICRSLIDRGADLLELGVPFSDPLADGLTNQLAAQRALKPVVSRMMCFVWFVKSESFPRCRSFSILITT